MESTWRKSLVEVQRCEIVFPRWLYIAAAILIAGYVVYGLRDVLTPILLAFIIAYILEPVVDRLEAWHVPRSGGHGHRARRDARRLDTVSGARGAGHCRRRGRS
jgi:hypothetical protein